MSSSQDNQNGGNNNYNVFNALTGLFTTSNPILTSPIGPYGPVAPVGGPRVAVGVGPNIRIPKQRDFGDTKVVPSPYGIVVSPTGKGPSIPMPSVPTMNLNVDPFGRVTDQRSLGVPQGVRNYNVDYKLGYGVASPYQAPKIIPDKDLANVPVISPAPISMVPGLGIGMPMINGPAPGPAPLAPIGIPRSPIIGGPDVRVVSPVPLPVPMQRPVQTSGIMGIPALSFGYGIPRFSLNKNYVRAVVNLGGIALEVVEGTKEDVARRLEGRIPGIRERLNLGKDKAVPIAPENILDDIRESGVEWAKDGDLLVAKKRGFPKAPDASSLPLPSSARAIPKAPDASSLPLPSSARATAARQRAEELRKARNVDQVKAYQARYNAIGELIRQGRDDEALQEIDDLVESLHRNVNSDSELAIAVGRASMIAQLAEWAEALGRPRGTQVNPAPGTKQYILQSGGADKQKKFKSANVILITNVVPPGKKDAVSAAVLFKKAYPADGTYVSSPYIKVEMKDGQSLGEQNLLEAAKKSIDIASSGYIKLDVANANKLFAFDHMLERGIFNRTYVIYLEGVDQNEHRNKQAANRSATSAQPLTFSDMRLVSLGKVSEAENYGRPVRMTDDLSGYPMLITVAVNAETDNQLKTVVKGMNKNPMEGVITQIYSTRGLRPNWTKSGGEIKLQ